MLVFDFPWAFAALPLPLFVWWLLPPYREISRAVRIPFFEEAAHAASLTPAPGAVVIKPNWAQKILAPLVWGLLVTAAVDPQWIEPSIERVESARDLILAIDLSQSMEARDFVDASGRRVDRLTAVKQVVDEFISRRTGDRIGLIVFGQEAFPQAPLTMDHESVRLLLDEVRIGMAGPQISIGDAIGVAIKMTEHSKTKERLLVLLTDGNNTASKLPPHKAEEIAKQRDITIHTIGIGNPRAEGEQRVDLSVLKRIAAATGGRSFRGEDRHDLEGIYRIIDDTTSEKVTRFIYRPQRGLFYYLLGAAVALLLDYHLVMMLLTRAQIPNHKHQVPTWMKISNPKDQART